MGIALRSRPARQAAALMIVAPLVAAPLLLVAGPAGAQADEAEVKGTSANTFEPAKLEVKIGTKVTWTLEGAHSVTGGEGPQADPESPVGDSGIGVPTYEVTFEKEGTFPYFCVPHESLGMVGEIVVSKAGPAKPTDGASPTQTAAAPVATSTPAPKDPNLGKETFEELDKQKAEPAGAMDNFRLLLWGLTAAMLVLSIGVFAATRPRRES
jgi:plastocyanin